MSSRLVLTSIHNPVQFAAIFATIPAIVDALRAFRALFAKADVEDVHELKTVTVTQP